MKGKAGKALRFFLERTVSPDATGDGRKVKQKEHRADALAPGADERRDKLRKAAGRSTCPVIRRCLNGETRMADAMHPCANP